MKMRFGTKVTPSRTLLRARVLWNMRTREARYKAEAATVNWRYARILALAQFAELLAWLGWLRAGDLFSLMWDKVAAFPPAQGGGHNLPDGVGCFLLTLLAQTKYSQDATADLVLAWKTSCGLQLGK